MSAIKKLQVREIGSGSVITQSDFNSPDQDASSSVRMVDKTRYVESQAVRLMEAARFNPEIKGSSLDYHDLYFVVVGADGVASLKSGFYDAEATCQRVRQEKVLAMCSEFGMRAFNKGISAFAQCPDGLALLEREKSSDIGHVPNDQIIKTWNEAWKEAHSASTDNALKLTHPEMYPEGDDLSAS
jgi:hypothetical protein